jgi:solute carrier family 32 (vesicular inhibitory amino acid transporter)
MLCLTVFFSFAICTTIYGAIAVIGYLMFGDKTLSQITLNLPKDSFVAKVALCSTVTIIVGFSDSIK